MKRNCAGRDWFIRVPQGVNDELRARIAEVEGARIKCIAWAREEQDRAESAEKRLAEVVKAIRWLSKCAKKFQIETDEKKRDGRIWDALYEAIERADAALAHAHEEEKDNVDSEASR